MGNVPLLDGIFSLISIIYSVFLHCLSATSRIFNCMFFLKENSSSEDELVLKMKAKLQGGVPFVWEFHCSEGGKHMVRK